MLNWKASLRSSLKLGYITKVFTEIEINHITVEMEGFNTVFIEIGILRMCVKMEELIQVFTEFGIHYKIVNKNGDILHHC